MNIQVNSEQDAQHRADAGSDSDVPVDQLPKSRWERTWPTIACGAGLFSDGYVQAVSH